MGEAAAEESALKLELRGTQSVAGGGPVALELVVSNGTSAACGVSDAVTATVLTTVTRDGRAVDATLEGPAFFTAGLAAPEESLADLAPGETRRLRIPSAGRSAMSVSVLPMGAGTGLVTSWDLSDPGRYRITATLAPSGVRGCAVPEPVSVEMLVGGQDDGVPTVVWVVGGAIVAGLLLLAVVLLGIRRSGAAALVVVAGLSGMLAQPRTAEATITPNGNPNTNKAVQGCLDIFTSPGGDPAGVYKQAMESKHDVSIEDGFSEASSTGPTDRAGAGNPKKGSGSVIHYSRTRRPQQQERPTRRCARPACHWRKPAHQSPRTSTAPHTASPHAPATTARRCRKVSTSASPPGCRSARRRSGVASPVAATATATRTSRRSTACATTCKR